ncbi:NADP-dependent 3-hydroxy acid dehydrogenase YdfG [Paenibacillus endophyticus]|uniref:NADP-dependent 3-hydroxy acid dehydrogenase YdfG n=1 Tax=Paenibacillus endophyticus TaxID=1294268 RepID=A0A7W5GB10_9BACL|nr:SDR family oxidoreductase [Paenibacillus endophyticus]MBB3153879.1 NADP-dependent 3-hydroxy acid dehydrogenase YdfG [Paenibacillus endophyticus]
MENIQDKVIIITGASSGIGQATALLLGKYGAKVVLAARREERLKAIAEQIQQIGGSAVYVKTDVVSVTEMRKLADYAIQQFGQIDVLINNAGIMPLSYIHELKIHEWDNMVDVNIKGVLYGIAAVLPKMREQKSGHIITVSSVSGYRVDPTAAVYSGTKFAVRAISEGVRQEEGPTSNIRTTIVSPGVTSTELTESITNDEIKGWVDQMSHFAISPDSIARAIAFAINEPANTSVNEMIVRPTLQPS